MANKKKEKTQAGIPRPPDHRQRTRLKMTPALTVLSLVSPGHPGRRLHLRHRGLRPAQRRRLHRRLDAADSAHRHVGHLHCGPAGLPVSAPGHVADAHRCPQRAWWCARAGC